MPIVNVNLELDDATYAAVKSGVYDLYGMVKDKDKRVRKHLPSAFDSAKEGAAKAIDVARAHKKELIFFGGVLALGGAAYGVYTYCTTKDKREAKKQFEVALKIYLKSAQSGALSIKIVDDLLATINTVTKLYKNEDIPLKLSAKEMLGLLNNIHSYTQHLAEANQFKTNTIKAPQQKSKNKVLDLKEYLIIQRDILEQAA